MRATVKGAARRPFVVLLGGGTASGKSTVARHLATRLGADVIGHDRYYKDAPGESADPLHTNFDHPDALETSLLLAHLRRILQGEPVELPIYDFAHHRRLPQTERLVPAPLVVVEGILVLASPELRELADLCVYVDAPDDVRLARRLMRDVQERGRAMVGVLRQYFDTVRPMHLRYVLPSRADADLVLDGEADPEESVERVADAIRRHGGEIG